MNVEITSGENFISSQDYTIQVNRCVSTKKNSSILIFFNFTVFSFTGGTSENGIRRQEIHYSIVFILVYPLYFSVLYSLI